MQTCSANTGVGKGVVASVQLYSVNIEGGGKVPVVASVQLYSANNGVGWEY